MFRVLPRCAPLLHRSDLETTAFTTSVTKTTKRAAFRSKLKVTGNGTTGVNTKEGLPALSESFEKSKFSLVGHVKKKAVDAVTLSRT